MLPLLNTERLVLRAFNAEDALIVQQLAGDRDVADTTSNIPHPYLEEMAISWIATHHEAFTENRAATFAVCLANGSFIGCVSLQISSNDGRGELGYWIGKPYWGHGYATEAASAIVNFGFKNLGLHRIYAYYLMRNPASARVLTKVGMKAEGVLRDHVRKWDQFESVGVHGILRSD